MIEGRMKDNWYRPAVCDQKGNEWGGCERITRYRSRYKNRRRNRRKRRRGRRMMMRKEKEKEVVAAKEMSEV